MVRQGLRADARRAGVEWQAYRRGCARDLRAETTNQPVYRGPLLTGTVVLRDGTEGKLATLIAGASGTMRPDMRVRLTFQVQYRDPIGLRMLRWTQDTSVLNLTHGSCLERHKANET